MKTSAIVSIIIAILVILGGWYAYATYYAPTANAPTTDNTNLAAGTQETGTTGVNDTPDSNVNVGADVNAGVTTTAKTVKVTLTANGFSPKSVTINKGDTVTWTNSGTGEMWVASANHPTHTVYDGTSLQQHCAAAGPDTFDECAAGTTFSFTFEKTGSWNYHNHKNSSQFGTVVVQ